MSEREQLKEAIAALEAKRETLGDSVVEIALAPLRARLTALDAESIPTSHSSILPAPSLPSERRVITLLFCDVKGSTAMAEKFDPEEWARIIHRALEYLIRPVQRHEGTVAQVMGDGILALFGAPLAHEDDPQRAVLAGLEILEGIRIYHEQVKRESQLDFNVRVGIHTGLVVVGEVGLGEQESYTAIGDAVNLAARMEQTARPGTVQISSQTYRLIGQTFECESLGEIQVKGKRKPVRTFQVMGHKATPGPLRGLERQGLHSPLVGRGAELAAVKACLDRLLNGQGGILGILGEAGIGKSRLIADVRSSSTQVLWLEGHTLSFGQTISYWPFQQILRGWASIAEDERESEVWNKLEVRVRALFGEETIDYLPYLASLLALEVRGDYAERVKYLDGDAMGKQIFLTSRRFFERLAREQPTVLVFEDLHWMDESSTHLLEHLLPLVERVPLLIVGLSRPERDTPAARLREFCASEYADHYTEIRLTPLSGADSAELIRNLLDIENLPSRLRELVVEKAEGNPFFLEEVIRTLIDTGAVARDAASGRWKATAQIEAIHIPDTIQGVIMARVDRLQAEVKQVLQAASVIGRSFLYRVLNAIAEMGRHLDDDLTELQNSELIRTKQLLPELEYMFKHALAQEATYESILLQKRRELHARVGGAIETLFTDHLEQFYGLLAYHYAKAEAWEKAQDYLLKAGDQAGSIAADAEALNLYQQAMVAYTRVFGDKWNPLQRASLERKMGEAFYRRGEFPQAIERFQKGLDYLGYRLPMSRWQVRRAVARELIVQVSHRLWPKMFVKPIAEAAEQGVEDEMLIYYYTGFIDALTNAERFVLLSLRFLNLSERRGYHLGVVIGSYGLGVALDFLALFGLAGWYHRNALHLAEDLQLPLALGNAHQGLQFHNDFRGELEQSLEHGRQSAQAYHEVGNLGGEAYAKCELAFVCVNRGDIAEGLAHSQELTRLGQDAEARDVWCWRETTQGYALRRQGHLQEAIAHQKKGIELAEKIPDYIYRVLAGAELGLCYLRQGDWQSALSELESSQRIAVEHHVIEPFSRVTTRNNLAEAYLFAAEQDNASQRGMWLNKAKRACRVALKESPKYKAKWPKAMRLQGTYEWLRGKPVASQKWWQKSLVEAVRMGLRYDAGMIHLEIGQRLGDSIHLGKAEAIFAEIGAELDLERTRNLVRG